LPIPILIEHVVTFVIVVLVTVMVLTFAFVAGAIGRRRRRDRYFEKLDELRRRWCRWSPASSETVDTSSSPPARAPPRTISVFEQLVVGAAAAGQLPALAKLCEDLGLIKRWQAPGQTFEARGITSLFVRLRFVSGAGAGGGNQAIGTAAVNRCW
jgi:hypothetical protein